MPLWTERGGESSPASAELRARGVRGKVLIESKGVCNLSIVMRSVDRQRCSTFSLQLGVRQASVGSAAAQRSRASLLQKLVSGTKKKRRETSLSPHAPNTHARRCPLLPLNLPAASPSQCLSTAPFAVLLLARISLDATTSGRTTIESPPSSRGKNPCSVDRAHLALALASASASRFPANLSSFRCHFALRPSVGPLPLRSGLPTPQ